MKRHLTEIIVLAAAAAVMFLGFGFNAGAQTDTTAALTVETSSSEVTAPRTFFPNRNQISVSYGDGQCLPIGCYVGEAFGTAIGSIIAAPLIAMFGGNPSDAIKLRDFNSYGILDIGYRYVLPKDRFAVGANLSYSLMTRTPQKKNDSASGGSGTDGSSASTGTADDGSKTTSLSDRKTTHHLLFVTTGATCYYKRSGWCKLYGALDLGVVYSYNLAELSPVFKNQCGFVLNVVPIGVQMGNDRASGFCDLSFGYKGFVNLGVRFSL